MNNQNKDHIELKSNTESDFDLIRDKPNSTKGIVKNSFSLLGLIIIGCLLGFWGGWEFGLLDSEGNIITLMIALAGCLIGGVIGAIVGVIIVSKNK